MRALLGFMLFGACGAAALSCRSAPEPSNDAPGKPNAAAPVASGAAAGPTRVRVDPALLKSGRVELGRVAEAMPAGKVRAVGEVIPAPDGEALVAALVAGRVASLVRHEGDMVSRGEVLAWTDAPEVGMARADLLKLDAEVELTSKRVARALKLSQENAISQSALEEAEAELAAAQAERAAIRARLGALGAERGSASRVALVAPISGEIVERNATLGGSVEPGRPLFRILSRERLRARVQFPGGFSPLPAVGESVTLRRQHEGAGTEALCSAKVSAVSQAVDPASRTVMLFFELGSACTALRAYEPIEVFVSRETQLTNAASGARLQSVPKDAVIDLAGVPHLFVAQGQPGEFVASRVVVDRVLGDTAWLSEGVGPNDQIAVRGVLLLKGEAQKHLLGGE